MEKNLKKISKVIILLIIVLSILGGSFIFFNKEKEDEMVIPDYVYQNVMRMASKNIPLEVRELLSKSNEILKTGILDFENAYYNETTNAWWINILDSGKEDCMPAAVIDLDDNTTEINWRCMGLEME